jgi:protein-L-isoaspartate(D-aspartate) O-methyltransferase
MVDFRTVRQAMVDGQVRTSDVTNLDLIDAMLDIPREAFVPERLAAFAYLDRDLALPTRGGAPRYLLKPALTARLIQACAMDGDTRVLVVGSGAGYAAAVASRLAGAVVALEEDPALAEGAQTAFRRLDLAKVTQVTGRLTDGWPAAAPYDVVLVEGGVEIIPDALFAQLSESGRLVTVKYDATGSDLAGLMGRAMLLRSVGGEDAGRPLFDATAPLLPGFSKAPTFAF